MGVFLALCGVCACALMQVLLLPIGRGFTGQCLDIGAGDSAAAIGAVVWPVRVTPIRVIRIYFTHAIFSTLTSGI